MTVLRMVYLFAALLLLEACKHPLAIEGKGDIIERLHGTRGCTYQEFQEGASRCDNEVTNDHYTVSYRAQPKSGWVFVGWEGAACDPESSPPRCDFNVTRESVDFINADYPNTVLPATTAVFKKESDVIAGIAEPVLDTFCLNCHHEGGVSGHTRLVLDNVESAQQDGHNIDAFRRFLLEVDDGRELILTKVRGGAGHGGGSIISSGSEEFASLSLFLDMLQGDAGSSGGDVNGDFWNGVKIADARATLRRAAILMAGRLPKKGEYSRAESGKSGLREAIRGLMKGEAFHDFLLRGANDRLLTDGLWFGNIEFGVLGGDWYPVRNERHNNAGSYLVPIREPFWDWVAEAQYGVVRAPLELIAYVVERDKPYTQIVTANYTMVNRATADLFNQTDVKFTDNSRSDFPSDQFKPAKNRGQIIHDDNYQTEYTQDADAKLIILSHGDFVEYPHAGVLSEPAFLTRYPSTETNRNRARARWTFYHFLGVDIEKAAGRTTDAAALADTNNPTLNNPNCAVCHRLHDPVAGAFQDFNDEGYYRASDGGTDSLPNGYKWPEEGESLWQHGDLWYRDMRAPGINGTKAPKGTSSIQWLGRQIARDPRFATAAVAFWWPALMGSEILEAPEVSSDGDYSDRLQAFEKQQEDIQSLADAFRTGIKGGAPYNLKDLLVEITLTNWFRAEGTRVAIKTNRSIQLRGVGTHRLLTPEELEEKTASLLGVRWGYRDDASGWASGETSTLKTDYNLYYGDIDSGGITERARQLTPIMANVAKRQALIIACPFIATDINRPDAEKLLFGGITRFMTPQTHEREIRNKLIEWHELLLGEKVANRDPELEAYYELLVEIWEHRKAELGPGNIANERESCWVPEGWWEARGYDPNLWWRDEEAQKLMADPEFMLGSWMYVLIGFLTDFNYLHE